MMFAYAIPPLMIIVILGAALFVAARPAPQSFAECYLEQMRGQISDMSPIAIGLCQQRTGQSLPDALRQMFQTTEHP